VKRQVSLSDAIVIVVSTTAFNKSLRLLGRPT